MLRCYFSDYRSYYMFCNCQEVIVVIPNIFSDYYSSKTITCNDKGVPWLRD